MFGFDIRHNFWEGGTLGICLVWGELFGFGEFGTLILFWLFRV